MNAQNSPSFDTTASASQPAVGPVRRFLREVWASYIAHSEMRVMLASGRWTSEMDQTARRRLHG